jgi:glycosyltransferase involved in cell wall biosynthesis
MTDGHVAAAGLTGRRLFQLPPQRIGAPALPKGVTVLQVLPALGSGGVERGTVEITQAIVQAGGRAVVASEGGRLVGSIERAGGRHLALPLDRKTPWALWRNADRLSDIIRREGVDIVHARSRAPAWSALLAARRTGAHFMTTYHGAYGENFPGKRLYNSVMARGERVIAISSYVAELLESRHRVARERIRIVPRGVDTLLFDPDAIPQPRIIRLATGWRLPDGAHTVMLPGRLTRWKGHAVLIAALAKLRRPDAVAVFVGDGRKHFEAELTREAERLGVAGQIRFVGHCDDMPAALMLADVVVNASLAPEGFGRTVIEAQAMRRPVIATDHGGAVETVEPGITGWRVKPGDAEALAAAIGQALSLSEEERFELGSQSRAWVQENYSVVAMQEATIGVYSEFFSR